MCGSIPELVESAYDQLAATTATWLKRVWPVLKVGLPLRLGLNGRLNSRIGSR